MSYSCSGVSLTSRCATPLRTAGRLPFLNWWIAWLLFNLGAGSIFSQTPGVARVIDYSRDVRPLLSDRCFACHGFDAGTRQADLRLDTREGATSNASGTPAIVPGAPQESELLRRIRSSDPDEQMPPADAHRQAFREHEIELLSEWIAQGAVWGEHWAFVKPVRPAISGEQHPIDFLVERQLLEIAVSPTAVSPAVLPLAPQAEPHTLVRRLSLDLLGLPPTPAQAHAFAQRPDEQGWQTLIDELLASPHFGERMAMWWLDGARYSDTDGFQQDATRENWPWRDWVVDAFNNNLPFDQFTIEQFAGDLIPDATPAQQLATCFHRNHMHNGEGGRDPAESRVDYVLDRVNTAGTLWLGLTLGCTQCHDHKFDPISQRDYYSLSAYFNSIDETGRAGDNAAPFLAWKAPTAEREVERTRELQRDIEQQLEESRAAARGAFSQWLVEQQQRAAAGYAAWRPVPIVKLATTEGYQLSSQDGQVVSAAPCQLPQDDYLITCAPPQTSRITAIRLEIFPHASHTDGKLSFSPSGEFILTNFKVRLRRRGSSQYRELQVAKATADVNGRGQDAKYAGVTETLDDDPRTGWTTRQHPGDQPHWAKFELAEPLIMAQDEELDIILMQRSIENRELIGRFALTYTDQRGSGVRSSEPLGITRLAEELTRLGSTDHSSISDELRSALFEEFLEDDEQTTLLIRRLELVKQQLRQAQAAAGELKVTVLKELAEPRATYVLERGVWNSHGEQVQPDVLPAILPVDKAQGPTRYELGKWVVSNANPLTARVIVNQIWQLLFGNGLVRTANDFGLQGELPSHPELLDWLAVEFMESGWDLKHLIKTIVSSHTYRRSSQASVEQLERDPHNRWLARGARFRLPAWIIRDARLATSGLLNRELGGPPMFPYQPPGVWEDQFMGRIKYQSTLGPSQYRRTLYAFWRRSSAPAFLFDAAQRRTCEVIPLRTNTPLQALNLLNDLTGQEAARSLADEVLPLLFPSTAPTPPHPTGSRQAIDGLAQRILSRNLSDAEYAVLQRQLVVARSSFEADTSAAQALLSVGQLPPPPSEQLASRAALMVVATTLMNLDECITHE
jgi:hypothetical protein